MTRLNIFFYIFLACSIFNVFYAQTNISADYYVSSSLGNDNNSGIDANNPWKSISKVNNSLPAGKKVAFKRGDSFSGTIIAKKACTYGAYGNGNKPKFGDNSATSRIFEISADNVQIQDIEIEANSWVRILGATNVKIENCYFHHYVKEGQLEADAKHVNNNPLLVSNSDFFVLKNSVIKGNYNSTYQDMIVIDGGSQYTLIENNYIDGGSHNSLYFRGSFENKNDRTYDDSSPNHTIVRNNHFFNHSHHCLSVNVGSWMTLIEGNYFERAGTGIDSSSYYNKKYGNGTIGSAIYNYGSGITRNNIIRRAGSNKDNRGVDGLVRYSIDGKVSEVFDQAIYNNTFWDNYSEAYQTGVYLETSSNFPDNLRYENISFVNNAFGGSKNLKNEDLYIYKANTSQNFVGEYRNNSFSKPKIRYGAGKYNAMTISEFNTSPPGNIISSGNLNLNPNFTSPNLVPADGDLIKAFEYFKLKPNSSLVDAGDFLTYATNSSSSSNKIMVNDAKYFMDGWGIIDGDKIQINNDVIKIISVDYEKNILTVDKNISWKKNDGISLPYSGNRPDIGAVESVSESSNSDEIKTSGINILLEGSFIGDNVQTRLINSTNFPEKQPYYQQPWNYTGDESISKVENNFVDWVLIELREDIKTALYRKAGILTTNGTIINTDGSDFSFENIKFGNYYLAVIHRNHLAVISSKIIRINPGSSINYDFTSNLNSALGSEPLVKLNNGKYAMIAGDSDANGVINNLDFGAVANSIPLEGYDKCDLDMNGIVNVLDYSFINKNILKSSSIPIN